MNTKIHEAEPLPQKAKLRKKESHASRFSAEHSWKENDPGELRGDQVWSEDGEQQAGAR